MYIVRRILLGTRRDKFCWFINIAYFEAQFCVPRLFTNLFLSCTYMAGQCNNSRRSTKVPSRLFLYSHQFRLSRLVPRCSRPCSLRGNHPTIGNLDNIKVTTKVDAASWCYHNIDKSSSLNVVTCIIKFITSKWKLLYLTTGPITYSMMNLAITSETITSK